VNGTLVFLAPTLSASRREARRFRGSAAASPDSDGALVRALASGARVVVLDPPGRDPGWESAKRRIFLPAAPGLLRDAIGGIAVIEFPKDPTVPGGPALAHWLPGNLTDRRALALLDDPPVPRLWIVEDYRRVRITAAVRTQLQRRGIRLAAFRALRRARRPRSRPVKGRIAR
jgi:hypothetical protein